MKQKLDMRSAERDEIFPEWDQRRQVWEEEV